MSRPWRRDPYEETDHDAWTQPGSSAALLVSSVVWLLWWAVSMIVGPIRLAIRRNEDRMTDDIWGQGDHR